MKKWRLGFCLVLLAPAAMVSTAQQASKPPVDEVLRQARQEISSFEKAGGKKSDPLHPVEKWAQELWSWRTASPDSADAAKATSEAVHLLIHADRFAEAQTRADQIPSDDGAWQGLSQVLFESASLQKNFTYFFAKLQSVLTAAQDPKIKAAVQLSLGHGWREQHEEEKAKAAFRSAMELAGDSPSGKQAETELYDLLHLGVGQPAPSFSATAVNGSRVSLPDYRGKPLVLVFWSTS
jgi:AhpC/TSA family